jgi:phosphate ABC transporter, ATP-binding protein
MEAIDLSFWYGGEKQALFDVNLPVKEKSITALIGPSGCGKSTLLRIMNRMSDLAGNNKVEGEMLLNGENIFEMDVLELRKRVGMIFQKPTPFPMTIRDNITYGPKLQGITKKDELDEIVETSLKRSFLWDEVEDRLNASALSLSGGQQQRLCIARALSIEPEIILMDEPTSALDPTATSKIEDLAKELKKDYTVVIVTHNMQQAMRISDHTGFMYLGKMEEYGETEQIFKDPKNDLTARYISGRFG